MNFQELGLSREILRGLEEMGFQEATPIQAQTIPLIMQGRDIIGHSQTGTGKTAAFSLPAIELLNPQDREVQVLVLCPTRELAVQSYEEIKKFSKYTHGIRALAIYGGQPIEQQIKALKHVVQIIIGTPGRVMDHMRRRTLKLHRVKMVVLDEADEMLNMGFREDIETILADVPTRRQTALFSATMSREIMEVTKEYQKDPELVKIIPEELTISAIEQICYQVPRDRKFEVLNMVLEKYDPKLAIVFCNTKKQVDELTVQLQLHGIKADGIHGDIKQATRIHVLQKFKTGQIKLLVATDVAARGIDVDGVDAVINYDIPQDLEYYVHRIGRTGRAGRSGRSFTFVSGGKEMSEIRDIERYIKAKISLRPLPTVTKLTQAKIDQFTADVLAAIQSGGLQEYEKALEALTDSGHSEREIALALLKLTLGKKIERNRKILEESRMARDKKKQQRATGRKEADKKRLNGRSRKNGRMARLMINIGKNQNISTGHIVAAVAGVGKIKGEKIGSIQLLSDSSLVEVPLEKAAEVVKNMKKCRIKGKSVQVVKQA